MFNLDESVTEAHGIFCYDFMKYIAVTTINNNIFLILILGSGQCGRGRLMWDHSEFRCQVCCKLDSVIHDGGSEA